MKKWTKRVAVILIVLIVAGGATVRFGLDYLARKGLEAGGQAALGVDTEVDAVAVGLFSSSVDIRGLEIGNPEGYATDRLLALDHGRLACSARSLFGDEAIIRELILNEPELTIELRAGLPPRSNIGDLLKSLRSRKDGRTEQDAGSEQAFKIDVIRITGTKVRFHLLAGQTISVPLPDIELKNISNRDGTPLLLADVFRQVLTSMSVSAFKKARGILPDRLLLDFAGSLGQAGKALVGLGAGVLRQGVGGAVRGAGTVLGKGAGLVGKGVGGAAKGAGTVLKKGAGLVGKGVGGAAKGAGSVLKGAGKKATDAIGSILGKKKPKEKDEDGK